VLNFSEIICYCWNLTLLQELGYQWNSYKILETFFKCVDKKAVGEIRLQWSRVFSQSCELLYFIKCFQKSNLRIKREERAGTVTGNQYAFERSHSVISLSVAQLKNKHRADFSRQPSAYLSECATNSITTLKWWPCFLRSEAWEQISNEVCSRIKPSSTDVVGYSHRAANPGPKTCASLDWKCCRNFKETGNHVLVISS